MLGGCEVATLYKSSLPRDYKAFKAEKCLEADARGVYAVSEPSWTTFPLRGDPATLYPTPPYGLFAAYVHHERQPSSSH